MLHRPRRVWQERANVGLHHPSLSEIEFKVPLQWAGTGLSPIRIQFPASYNLVPPGRQNALSENPALSRRVCQIPTQYNHTVCVDPSPHSHTTSTELNRLLSCMSSTTIGRIPFCWRYAGCQISVASASPSKTQVSRRCQCAEPQPRPTAKNCR